MILASVGCATASRPFVEDGPSVPYAELARQAGVGVGTVYRHFPTRDGLIEAAYRAESMPCAPPFSSLRTRTL